MTVLRTVCGLPRPGSPSTDTPALGAGSFGVRSSPPRVPAAGRSGRRHASFLLRYERCTWRARRRQVRRRARVRGGFSAASASVRPKRPTCGHITEARLGRNDSPLDGAWVLPVDRGSVAGHPLLPTVPVPLLVHPVVVVTVHGESDLGAVASNSHRPDFGHGPALATRREQVVRGSVDRPAHPRGAHAECGRRGVP